jgi:cytochrome c-type biogenesis protein CcsB
MFMHTFFSQLALLGYGVSLIFFFLLFFSPKSVFPRLATTTLLASFTLHTIALITQWITTFHFPILDIKESLSFVAWFIVLIYFCLYYRFRMPILGTFFVPLVVVLMLIGRVVPKLATPPKPIFKTFWLYFHISTSLLGDTLLAVAFCAGIMYLLQERQIKQKKLKGIFIRFPSLFFLDTLNYHALVVGFVLLTLGLLSGALYAQWVKGRFWNWDPKEIWSLITWLVYAILIHQRLMLGWRGRQAAWFSIIGFCFLLFTFLGVNYLFQGYHRFG